MLCYYLNVSIVIVFICFLVFLYKLNVYILFCYSYCMISDKKQSWNEKQLENDWLSYIGDTYDN